MSRFSMDLTSLQNTCELSSKNHALSMVVTFMSLHTIIALLLLLNTIHIVMPYQELTLTNEKVPTEVLRVIFLGEFDDKNAVK